jgi:hypothetical protein
MVFYIESPLYEFLLQIKGGDIWREHFLGKNALCLGILYISLDPDRFIN